MNVVWVELVTPGYPPTTGMQEAKRSWSSWWCYWCSSKHSEIKWTLGWKNVTYFWPRAAKRLQNDPPQGTLTFTVHPRTRAKKYIYKYTNIKEKSIKEKHQRVFECTIIAVLVASRRVLVSQLSAENRERDLYSNILNPGLINLTSNSYPAPTRRMLHNDTDRGRLAAD